MHKRLIGLLVACLSLSGCASLRDLFDDNAERSGSASSVVEFLYPKGQKPDIQLDRTPELRLPIRVGVAFIPEAGGSKPSIISSTLKASLVSKVATHFKDRRHIDYVVPISSNYLSYTKGFNGLEQIANIYGVDVIALISYDQLRMQETHPGSLLFWTLGGPLTIPFFPGDTLKVHTFVDTAVIDIQSRKLLFRAAGTHNAQRQTTMLGAKGNTYEQAEASFSEAIKHMTANLETEIISFEARVKSRNDIKVSYRSGGSGSNGLIMLLSLIGCGLLSRKLGGRSKSSMASGSTNQAQQANMQQKC